MVLDASTNHTTEVDCAAFAAVEQESCSLASSHDSSVADRKLGLLKRTGLFSDNLKGCTIERACTAADLRQAYRLVHDVYLGSGFIDPDPSGMRLRIYETSAETATFVAKVDGRVVGVLSVVEDSTDLGLPSDSVFKAELDVLRQAGRRLCEVTNQAIADGYRKSAVATELMRTAIAVSLTEGYHEAIAAVSPSHNGFYELLGFRQIGSQRSYSRTIDDPVIAVSMDVDQYRTPQDDLSATARFMRQFLTEGNRFLSCVTEWAHDAKREFLNPDLLKQLFVLEKNFLARCSPAELQILHRRWGHEMFAAVTADVYIPASPRTSGRHKSPRVPAAAGSRPQKKAASRTSSPDLCGLPPYDVRHFRRTARSRH